MADKPKGKKNPHAVALGKSGGKKRAETMDADKRSDAARWAVNVRWDNYRKRKAAESAVERKPRRGRKAAV